MSASYKVCTIGISRNTIRALQLLRNLRELEGEPFAKVFIIIKISGFSARHCVFSVRYVW